MSDKLTKKQQIETLAAGVRPLQAGEYYLVTYNRPYGAWAYWTFRSAKAAAKFIVTPPENCKNVSNSIRIFKDGFEVKTIPTLEECQKAGTHMVRCTADGYCKVCFQSL